MPIPGGRKYTGTLRALNRDMRALLVGLARDLNGIIARASLSTVNGTIDPSQERAVLRDVGLAVQRVFVGADGRHAFGLDGVTALSPYADLLNRYYVRMTVEAVSVHQQWMQKHIPADVYLWLSRQNVAMLARETFVISENDLNQQPNESREDYLRRLTDTRLFAPNPLAEYEPMHTWVDPRGYRLSDRIWRTSEETRRKIDAMVAEAIRTGEGAADLAKKLEQFLDPGRANLRTVKPYGVDASYDAMRLARTEIARAAAQASYISAYLNPYVTQIDVLRSAKGDPNCKVCAAHATINIQGQRTRAPYSIHAANIPVYHPHCKCRTQPVLTDSPETVTKRLRELAQQPMLQFPGTGQTGAPSGGQRNQSVRPQVVAPSTVTGRPAVTPALGRAFMGLLLGRLLGNYSTAGL